MEETIVKKKRGRPRKNPIVETAPAADQPKVEKVAETPVETEETVETPAEA